MGLLSISTPSKLYSLITGSCSEYKVKCISETQKSFFYFALMLIMIGRSTRDATIETLNFKGNADEKDLKEQFIKSGSGHVVVQATLLVLLPWSIIFAVSSLYSSMSVFLLMEKSWTHKIYIDNPERSPVTGVVRVYVASISKIAQEIKSGDLSLRRITTFRFRFIEKAAIRPPNDKGRQNRWTLCSIQEVEDMKTLVRMLPVCVMYGFLVLISTLCGTYFLQQAKRMKPLTFFTFFGAEVMISVSYLAWIYLKEEIREKFKYNNMYRNMETLRCAALVEKSRLGVIRNYGLANKPGEIIPMSTFWLLPQLLMLGYVNARLEQILQIFFNEDMPLPMLNFKIFVFEGFIGVANISSVLVVYVVGKISEMGGKTNWFQHDTENSRLDLFYWTLSMLCVLVFAIWFLVYHASTRDRTPILVNGV
ncbi:protein NRT1/ PTR FAMILY 5.5-like [Bidens hawaiensis]|uniref:protein NRT1/ PTR FAMILY 5.5-like n=1 Tax=Bidens hawaiensis TaxID=980011 RepID=UPI00404AB0B4